MERQNEKEMKFICKKCGSTDYKIIEKSNGNGIATGLYCAKCGQWQKWLNKQEKVFFADDINDNRVIDKDNEIARLKAENAELKARLEKAVELPCQYGEEIYSILNFGAESVVLKGTCERVIYKKFAPISETTVWAVFASEMQLHPRIFCNESLKLIFKTRKEAEKRLAELQEGKK